MRIPLSWLREFAEVPAAATAEEVMTDLVKVGFEEEDVHRPTDTLQGPIVVGQVLSLVKEPQTNGKTINWCQVRVVPEGQEQTLTGKGIDPSGVQGIICGAHNFVEGDKVVVTLPGAVLPGDFHISARKTYGHLSAGMIASVRELGIGEDHDGILVLSRIGLDPEIGTDAMELLGLYDEAADEAGTDVGTAPDPVTIELPAAFAAARIGIDFSEEQIVTSLEDLGAAVVKNDGGWSVTAPSWRHDLETKEDLSEEIARLVGYDRIPATLPVAPPGRGLTRVQQQRRRLIQALADAGLTEVLSYPFVSKAANDTFGVAEQGATRSAVKLANPISEEQGFLRTSILPGLIEVAKRNHSRGFRDLALFESGLVFLPAEGMGTDSIPPLGVKPADEVLDGLYDGVPAQPFHLAVVLTGHDSPAAAAHAPRMWDWADALDIARIAGDVLGVEVVVRQGSHQAFHPGRAAQLSLRTGEVVGHAGELHPKLLDAWDMPARSVALELNAGALFEAAPDVIVARHISTFPVATQDVALVVPADVPADDVLSALREGAGELLEDVALFDVYAGKGIEEGKKSLAFGLRFRANDRTLTADEASAAREGAVALAAERFGAVQR